MAGLAKYAVEMGIALIVASLVIAMGLRMIAEANLTGVDASVSTVFTVILPILAVLGLALKFMPQELKSKAGL